MNPENVILVDANDQVIGVMEKMEAHRKGLLHRAFSVYIFNDKGELMLQQRALDKYHSGGLWTNTCCSHPRPGEDILAAAQRRLQEEMGFSTELKEVCTFSYNVKLDKGMTEHELLHVFKGKQNGGVHQNPEEVASWKFVPVPEVMKDMAQHPDSYTEWFKITLPLLFDQEGNSLVD